MSDVSEDHITFRLLGDLRILAPDRSITIPGGNVQRVLAALLLAANRLVTKDDLLRAGWGTITIAEAQLHKAINAIRDLLDQVGHREALRTQPRAGYELRVETNQCDLLLFQHLVRRADDPSVIGTEEEITLRRQALQLWTGSRVLANLPGNSFQAEIEDLSQRRKRNAVRLFELEVSRRGYNPILADLTSIATEYPIDQRLTEMLMVVAYRCGHPDNATRAYQRHKGVLDEKRGADPKQETKDLHFAILRADEVVIKQREEANQLRPPEREAVGTAVPRELPAAPAEFVGREDTVAEAQWLLTRRTEGAPAVVLISGPSGVGKTALARRVAQLVQNDFPDGQVYLELRDAAGAPMATSEALAHCLRALGVHKVPETHSERISMTRTRLADRRMLLVLDDAWDADQIRDLIPGNSRCAVLITAQHQMPDLDSSYPLTPLQPLDASAALELFLKEVRRNRHEPTEADLPATERLVALCEGLPLAICIVAALRVSEWNRPIADLVARLERSGPEAITIGSRSLARSIGANLDRLSGEARELFLRLGLLQLQHIGAWTALSILDGPDADPYGALSQLLSSNVLAPTGTPGRYRFHALTQQYAHHLATREYSQDGQGTVERVYGALLTKVRRAHRGLHGGDYEVVRGMTPDWAAPAGLLEVVEANALGWFEIERPNIRAAVKHCADLNLVDLCWDLAQSTHEYYGLSGQFDDWYATHTVALDACRRSGDRRGEGIILATLGQPALVASRRSGVSGIGELERAIELLEECDDQHGQAIARRTLANALRRRGHLTRPIALFGQAAQQYRASGDDLGDWQALRFIGQTYLDMGDFERARDVTLAAMEAANRLNGPLLVAQTNYWLGQVYLGLGKLDQAEAAFIAVREAMPGAGAAAAYALHGLGDVARLRHDFASARRDLDEAAMFARKAQDATLEGRIHMSLALLHGAQNQPDDQVRELTAATTCFTGGTNPYHEAAAWAALSQAEADRSQLDPALQAWARVEALYEEMDLPAADRIHRPPHGPAVTG